MFSDITATGAVTLRSMTQGQGARGLKNVSIHCSFLCMAGADVRVRVRPGVIRVRIAEAGIRPVIRVTTPEAEGSPFPFLPTGAEPLSRPLRGPRGAPSDRILSLDYKSRFVKELSSTNVRTCRPKKQDTFVRQKRPVPHPTYIRWDRNMQGGSRSSRSRSTRR